MIPAAKESLIYFSMVPRSGLEILYSRLPGGGQQINGAIIGTRRWQGHGLLFTKHVLEVMVNWENMSKVRSQGRGAG